MRQYLRHRSGEEVIALCDEQQIPYSAARYEKGGDHIVVVLPGPDGQLINVLFNVISGRFFHSGDFSFSSDSQQNDGQSWFDAMLDLFYVEQP